jgi:hypothetical protein
LLTVQPTPIKIGTIHLNRRRSSLGTLKLNNGRTAAPPIVLQGQLDTANLPAGSEIIAYLLFGGAPGEAADVHLGVIFGVDVLALGVSGFYRFGFALFGFGGWFGFFGVICFGGKGTDH